jgi:branched-chain amino acid transport system ATP-binding protein
MLEVREVSAGYATGTVLRGISLRVAEGELLALLGRNGMGKTTLLRAVAGCGRRG